MPDVAVAISLVHRGDLVAAQRLLTAHLQTNPSDAMAHRAMGLAALGAGQPAEAVANLQQAIACAPNSPLLHCELGRLLASIGEMNAALQSFRQTTELAPGAEDGWFFVGITLDRLNRREEALPFLRRAHALAPESLSILRALADCEFHAGLPEDALAPCLELVRHNPSDIAMRLRLGETFSRLDRHEDAVATYRTGLQGQPTSADLWLALAQAEEDCGRRDGAIAAYERALELRSGWPVALAGLLSLHRRNAPDHLVQQAHAALAASLHDSERALLGFELGKVLDSRGAYDAAMTHWHMANAARRRQSGPLDTAALDFQVASIVDRFTPEAFHGVPPVSRDARPVFVVGMPRSGTTLTEQILAAHPYVHGCGELPHLALIARALTSTASAPIASSLEVQARRYLAAAERNAGTQARRLIDKAPLNFFHLGLAALLFPGARVIWCRRDPRDVAISIYSENFALDSTFATDLADIGHYINAQERLMRHWQAVLPLPILELQYEDLVAEPDLQARRLIEFVDLEWTPDCLQFHRSTAGVQTPSRWQVREPVHTRSVARWRRYERDLAPLLATLASALPRAPAD